MFQSDTEVLNIQVFILRWEQGGSGGRQGLMGAGSKKLLALCDHEPQFYIKGKKKTTGRTLWRFQFETRQKHQFHAVVLVCQFDILPILRFPG